MLGIPFAFCLLNSACEICKVLQRYQDFVLNFSEPKRH